ncbi:MAG: hypothetical protein U1A25_03175 [Candidatus Sungbacteria bacterium]|nr:hypothetical protein [bacterium]MDZ4260645.1 hypothetical protein [Candidatus Sungbacteria bacterium]
MIPVSVTNKKTLPSLLITIFTASIFIVLFPAHFAFAYTDLTDIPAAILGVFSTSAMAIWYLLMYIIQMFLASMVFIVAFILDNVFIYNIYLNPSNMPAVIDGWLAIRDMANSLFLLVMVWVAIKMIFGLDDDKRLLVKIIIIAFLMNFSLAITSASFGLGNALAKPFRDLIGNDVAAFIINKTKLNTITAAPSERGKDAYIKAIQSDAPQCGLGALLKPEIAENLKLGCVMKQGIQAYVTVYTSIIEKTLSKYTYGLKETVELTVSNLFLAVTIGVLWVAVFLLVARIIAMAFLGILAPAAFFLLIFPMSAGKKMFDDWLHNLLRWSFVAPTFYFLFYISLLILDTMTKAPALQTTGSGAIPFSANVLAMLPLVVFLAFLVQTIKLTKKMGGEYAAMAIDMGKKITGAALAVGTGVATAGGSLAATAALGAAARATQPAVTGAMDRLSNRPILGKLTAPATNAIRSYYSSQDREINDMKATYQSTPPKLLSQQIRSTTTFLSAKKKVAMAEALHEQGPGAFDNLKADEQSKVLNLSRQFGREDRLLKARLDLATKDLVPNAVDDHDAKRKIYNKLKPEEKSKISKYALEDAEVKKIVLENETPQGFKQMIQSNWEMGNTLISFFRQYGDTLTGMREDTRKFIQANMIRARIPAPTPKTTPPSTPAP